jgi:cytochrome c peroxidase
MVAAVTLVGSAIFVGPAGVQGQAQEVTASVGKSTRVGHDVPLGLDLYMPVPDDNPITEEKLALGRQLFFDTRLSVDRTKACATCHVPERAFTDGRQVAEGVQGRQGTRNTPTLVNRGYGASHFLDGRAGSLEEQVLQPIEGESELAYEVALAVSRLQESDDYQRAFERTFGRSPDAETLAWALASYVRSILAGNSPVDRFRHGDRRALSSEEAEGLRIFVGKGNCSACHVGPNVTDEEFHNTGVAWADGRLIDPGRFRVTGLDQHKGSFKTPTLRELPRTAPYMHDGSIDTLEEVVDFYDGGGTPNPFLDDDIRPLDLTADEKRALVAFLRALTGSVREGTR